MTDEPAPADPESDALKREPDPSDEGVEPYEVLVQWKRGAPHEHAETIDAPSDRMALMLAKRNVDMRQEPISIWVVPRAEVTRTVPEDQTLELGTDRSYRNIQWYAENQVPVEEGATDTARAEDG